MKWDLYEFETNVKNFFNDHKASKCLKIILSDFSCGQNFETEEEVNEHMKTILWWKMLLKVKIWNNNNSTQMGARERKTTPSI